jgi:hypothetical protein
MHYKISIEQQQDIFAMLDVNTQAKTRQIHDDLL